MSRSLSGNSESHLRRQTSQLSPSCVQNEQQIAYLKEIFSEVGVVLSYDDKPNLLLREQCLILREMEKSLRIHISYPNNIDEFIIGLKCLCSQHIYLQKALMPTQLKKLDIVINQDSLFRLILNIDSLQKPALDFVLEILTTHATQEPDNISLIPLLLNAVKYLPYIQQPRELSQKLLDILEVATYPSQLEILNSIPEIIPDGQYEELAKQLILFLNENCNLAGAVINCLNLLSITPDLKNEIQDCILSKLFTEDHFNIFPIVYEFLITCVNLQNLPKILLKIRNVADMIMVSRNKDADTNKLILLQHLKSSAISSKMIYDGWLTLISNFRIYTDHKPIDFLILFLLYDVANAKKKTIETVLRKKITGGLFKIQTAETLFSKYITVQILKDYFNNFTELACCLLQSNKNQIDVNEFISEFIKMLFLNENTDCIQHQCLLHSLLYVIDEKNAHSILKILIDLIVRDLPRMQQHTLQLMGLLEKLDDLELAHIQMVFEILCSLTCGVNAIESTVGFKDELHMLIRKQMSSCKKCTKHKGIVAAVVMIKYIAKTSKDQSSITIDEDSSMSIADLPDEASRQAAGLLDLVRLSAENCSNSVSLYYDQLASMMITAENLDKYFVAWLIESTTDIFQKLFITDNVPQTINGIELTSQFSLNSDTEIEAPIWINIAELTIKNHTNTILVLAPLFRLLRLLHYKQNNGDLSTIDALLGCGVIMPNTENITNMELDKIKLVADCIFHCINWFRENISGFITQRNKQLRYKIIKRLDNLIELENLLAQCMENIPGHNLPVSNFDSININKMNVTTKAESKNAKRTKTSAKSNEIINETVASTSAITTQTVRSTSSIASKSSKNFQFRVMDTDIMRLLKCPVKLDTTEQLSQITSTPCESLNLQQFCFVLNDVNTKLDQTIHHRCTTLSIMNFVNPIDMITDLRQFLPSINRCFQTLIKSLTELLEQNDGHQDLPEFFSSNTMDMKYAHGLILQMFSLIFSWSGFQISKNLDLLRDILKSMRDDQSSQLNSVNRLILDFCTRLYQSSSACLYLPTAINLVKTIQSLYSINRNADVKKMIVAISGKLLKKKWYNIEGKPDTGKMHNDNIEFLLKAYLDGANIKTLCGLVGTLQKQAPDLKRKNDCLSMLPSVDKSKFHVLLRSFCQTLQERVSTEIVSLTNEEHLELWRTTALTLQGLMTVVKVQETKANLVCFLNKSLRILKIFLAQGVPMLEITIKSEPDEVTDILKSIQTTTRFLHHLCCHSKLTKDTSLMAYVPHFRLTLETLVYRVKAALVANNCSDAFWMGNLRNRDLYGTDILTQDSTSSLEESEEKSDIELPEDDSTEEVEMEATDSNGTSVSDII